MAAVDVVMLAPPPPPPPPVPVVRISRLAMVAADAVVCLWILSLWFLLASVACALIRLLACGWGCTAAPWMAVFVSLLFVAMVSVVALELSKFEETFHDTNQLKKGAAALEPISVAVKNAHFIAITALAYLEALGFLLKLRPEKYPPTERFASVIMVVPPLGIFIMCCFLSVPVLAVRGGGWANNSLPHEMTRPRICGTHLNERSRQIP